MSLPGSDYIKPDYIMYSHITKCNGCNISFNHNKLTNVLLILSLSDGWKISFSIEQHLNLAKKISLKLVINKQINVTIKIFIMFYLYTEISANTVQQMINYFCIKTKFSITQGKNCELSYVPVVCDT